MGARLIDLHTGDVWELAAAADARWRINSRTGEILLRQPGVSKHHGAVEYSASEDAYFLCDGQSANGFFLRGTRVVGGARVRLEPGEIISAGNALLKFERDA